MFLLGSLSGIRFWDMIIQLIAILILIALVVGVVLLIKMNKQLNNLEEKSDKNLCDK